MEAFKETNLTRKPTALVLEILADPYLFGTPNPQALFRDLDIPGIKHTITAKGKDKFSGPVKFYACGIWRLLSICHFIKHPHTNHEAYDEVEHRMNRLSSCSTKNKNYTEFVASEGERKRVKVCQPLKKSVKKDVMTMEMIKEFLKTADADTCSAVQDLVTEREEAIVADATEGEYVPIHYTHLTPPEGWEVEVSTEYGVIWTDGNVFVSPEEVIDPSTQKWEEEVSDETGGIILVKVK